MKFSYKAKDAQGNVRNGSMVADSEKAFNEKMREKGLRVISVQEVDSKESKKMHKFGTKELAFNCRQMSAMMSAGLTLVKTLDILCKEQTSDAAKDIWREIYEDVQKGESFSQALEQQTGCFPDFLISMIAAGESSGALDVIMQRMSDHYAKENRMNNKIKGAMIYPIVLLVLCIAVVIGMFTFIMPMFRDMFTNPDDIPALTQFMFGVSDFIKARWYVLVAIVAILIFGFIYGMKIPSFKYKVDRFVIKGPGFGPLVMQIYTGRFARTLSSLYSSGIPMVECLQRSSAILGNTYIDDKFEQVISEVKQGEPLSAAIQRTELFDSMFCSIIYVGEESGALDDILNKTSDYYEEESDSAIQRLIGIMEPVMIIILGVMVGCVVAAVLPALYASFEGIE
ncbi:MAG: type II secretion system F family protein [Oscillospiraceae bacterium]